MHKIDLHRLDLHKEEQQGQDFYVMNKCHNVKASLYMRLLLYTGMGAFIKISLGDLTSWLDAGNCNTEEHT